VLNIKKISNKKKENAKDSKKNIFDYKDKSKYNIKSENKESEKRFVKKFTAEDKSRPGKLI
jgi:hypothetical protein